jgi:hypothetical protein
MLIDCPECGQKVSDQAGSCPQCGHPIAAAVAKPAAVDSHRRGRSSVFCGAAFVMLVLAAMSPRILVTIPVGLTVILAAISLVRRERLAMLSLIVIGLALWLAYEATNEMSVIMAGTPSAVISETPAAEDLGSVEIADWNWHADPLFGSRGTIKWNVEVHNRSTRNIRSVKVEFTTYDKGGKLVASTFAFVEAIPAGATRGTNSFADLYGTEKTATVQPSTVQYER